VGRHPGIEVRHGRNCGIRLGRRCSCRPGYQAQVWSGRDRKRIRKTFGSLAEPRAWRQETQVALRRRTLNPLSRVTLREVAEAWIAGAADDTIRNRSGDRYKPSALRGYEQALRSRILPALGDVRLSDLMRPDLQDLADRMLASGLDPSTIRNTFTPLRAIFRRAVARGEVAVNPTTGLELSAVRGRRERVASPVEASRLVAALPESDRALWATALYAGLRLGELRALRWVDVDFSAGVIHVCRAWDPHEGEIAPKSRAGVRDVPIPAALRSLLVARRLASERADGLVFGRSFSNPFNPATINVRARKAWKTAGLASIGLHEARHTYASLMIAAGVNAKALTTYMCHSSVTTTYDRYGHLMPGNTDEAAALLDAFLEHSSRRARSAHRPRVPAGRIGRASRAIGARWISIRT
jgi:integrase